MNKVTFFWILIVLVGFGVLLFFTGKDGAFPFFREPDVQIPVAHEAIRITTPLPQSLVSSPLILQGEARGSWYFEASFPARLYDGKGKELLAVPVMAQGEWMTTEFVPFLATLTFTMPATATGTLVLEKDNPSGLPEHADSIRIPVRFK